MTNDVGERTLMRTKWMTIAVAAALLLPQTASAATIRVQSTTDTVDAGLVEGLLRDAYKQAAPDDTLDYTAVGTGAALTNARNGLADVVITHAPSLEKQFVDDGYSVGLGKQIFYSDYVVVGPEGDPAGVLAKHPHDAVGAFEDIDAYGVANPGAVRFLSRGDNSGTNVQEQIIWGLGNETKQQASNFSGNTARFEPGTGGAYPTYYKKTNTGQAANVNQTSACADVATHDGCYTMVDRGTFNRLVNAGTVTNVKIVSDKNTAGTRGGENLLVNPFSIYVVNPAKISTNPGPNVVAGTRFADFLVSASFQKALESFPNALDPAFLPDAFPKVTITQALTPTAAANSNVTVAGTAVNRLPGGGAISGLPVQLQQSTDNGATWTDVGAPAPTGTDGSFTATGPVSRSGTFRLSLPSHPASSYNQFSATTQDLGPVTVSQAAVTPTPSPVPTPTTADTKRPSVSGISLTRKRLKFTVSERATVKAVISRRVEKKNGGFTFKKVQSVTLKPKKAGSASIKHKPLRKGTYRIRITATDQSGNVRTVTKTVKRK